MSGIYVVKFQGVTVAADQDLITALPHALKLLSPISYHLSARSFTDGEVFRLALKYGATSNGSGGGSFTPLNTDLTAGAAAAGFTARINDTTPASGGTIVEHDPHEWNLRNPLDVYLTLEQQKLLPPAGNRFSLTLLADPGASTVISGSMYFRELG
jgi:hypothetical protein